MSQKSEQKLAERVNNRSHKPSSEKFLSYIGSHWAPGDDALPSVSPVAKFAAARRKAVAERFAGKLVVIEAGSLKTRTNDTDYRFRPHSAFAHLTGWGVATVPDSVLVIDARGRDAASTQIGRAHV